MTSSKFQRFNLLKGKLSKSKGGSDFQYYGALMSKHLKNVPEVEYDVVHLADQIAY